MILKKSLIILFVGTLIILSGCNSTPPEQIEDAEKFIIYDGQEYLGNVEYRIYDLTQPIIVYFPVISNKEITDTQFGGVGAKLKLSNGTATIKLKRDTQDFLNNYYSGYYISFLKYQVSIDNYLCLQANDSIELCDTLIWIYHNSEFETMKINNTYLQISIVANDSEKCLPDWNFLLDDTNANIQSNL